LFKLRKIYIASCKAKKGGKVYVINKGYLSFKKEEGESLSGNMVIPQKIKVIYVIPPSF